MKKRFYIFSLLILICITTHIGIVFSKDKAILKYENNSLLLEMSFSNSSTTIYPWFDENEEVYYFFLPSYMKDFPIRLHSDLAGCFFINEETLSNNLIYDESLTYYFSKGTTPKMPIKFLCSANLPSLFVTLEPGGIDYVHENKDHYASGSLLAIDSTGNVDYDNSLEYIS